MSDKIIRANHVENAEAWVMPEMGGSHVVRSNRDNKAGGYKRDSQKLPVKAIPKALTAARIDALKADAESRGFEQGREAGYQRGYEEAQSAGRELLDGYKAQMETLLERLASEIEQQLDNDRDALEEAVAELIVQVCEEVCMQQIAHAGSIVDIVKTALFGLPTTEKQVTLYVNPDDYALLKGSPELSADYLDLQADETLSRGSCRVTSEHSDIKFHMEDRIRHSVHKHFSAPDVGDS